MKLTAPSPYTDHRCEVAEGPFWYDEALWWVDVNPGLLFRCALAGVTLSNGLGWSRDDRFFYYIDSTTHRLDVFDFEPAVGEIANRRTLADFSGEPGMPDGMCVGPDGAAWVAFLGGACVLKLDQNTGREIGRVELPCPNVTSCCFGGSEGRTLFITTASKNIDLPLFPNGGKVFCLSLG